MEKDKHEKVLRGLQRLPENKRCFNCESLGTQYVVPSLAIFVCTECSGKHMNCGQRVKSVSMGTFTPQEIAGLEAGGNAKAAERYLAKWRPEGDARKPTDKNPVKVEAWVRTVFLDKKYYSETPVAVVQPTPSTSGRRTDDNIPVRQLQDLIGNNSLRLQVDAVKSVGGVPIAAQAQTGASTATRGPTASAAVPATTPGSSAASVATTASFLDDVWPATPATNPTTAVAPSQPATRPHMLVPGPQQSAPAPAPAHATAHSSPVAGASAASTVQPTPAAPVPASPPKLTAASPFAHFAAAAHLLTSVPSVHQPAASTAQQPAPQPRTQQAVVGQPATPLFDPFAANGAPTHAAPTTTPGAHANAAAATAVATPQRVTGSLSFDDDAEWDAFAGASTSTNQAQNSAAFPSPPPPPPHPIHHSPPAPAPADATIHQQQAHWHGMAAHSHQPGHSHAATHALLSTSSPSAATVPATHQGVWQHSPSAAHPSLPTATSSSSTASGSGSARPLGVRAELPFDLFCEPPGTAPLGNLTGPPPRPVGLMATPGSGVFPPLQVPGGVVLVNGSGVHPGAAPVYGLVPGAAGPQAHVAIPALYGAMLPSAGVGMVMPGQMAGLMGGGGSFGAWIPPTSTTPSMAVPSLGSQAGVMPVSAPTGYGHAATPAFGSIFGAPTAAHAVATPSQAFTTVQQHHQQQQQALAFDDLVGDLKKTKLSQNPFA